MRSFWRPDVRQDVDDELAFHLEMRRRDYVERGESEAAARDRAARRFGDVERVAAACRTIDERWHREQRRAGMWTDFRQDVAYGWRSLRKHPAFTAVAIVTLALGIGANTAIFSVIRSVLLRPLPYRDADRLVFVWSSSASRGRLPLTPGTLVDYRERLTAIDALAGISQFSLNLTGDGGEPERIDSSSVSSSFFDVLGTPALVGEPFHTGRADARDVVLSYGLWVRRFGGDRSIVGRDITLNGTARRVVAVMPKAFAWPTVTALPNGAAGPQLWIPGAAHDIPRTPIDRDDEDISSNRTAGYIRAVGRLKDGVDVRRAQQEAEAVAARLGRDYPRTDANRGAEVVPLRGQFFGPVERPLLVLVGAVAFVLAIACANVANLLFGRATARRKEIAVRLALGAARGRIVRQLLTESILVAFAGAACGLVVAWWAQKTLVRLSPAGILRLDEARLDPVSLLFTLGLAVLTGVLFGSLPAWQSSGGALTESLGEGGTRASAGPGVSRTRDLLAAGEVAVALVLLVGAVLLVRSFAALARVDTGIDSGNLLTFEMHLSGERAEYQSRQIAFYDRALERISAIPGVRSAGAAVTLPIGGDDFSSTYLVEGRPQPAAGAEPTAGFQIVTPRYFQTMGIRLLAGRDFTTGDIRTGQAVAIVNQSLARREWPGGDPIGQRLRLTRDTEPATIVGVVSDIRHLGPAVPPRPEFYLPYTQRSFPFMAFVVRTGGATSELVPSIRRAIADLDPLQPISRVATMDEHIARSLSRPRFMSILVGAFGALALSLAVVGIYGVMSYAVTQRSREIAIRMALGASRGDVLKMVLSRTLVLALAGVTAGLVLSMALTSVLTGLLFGVTTRDPLTFTAAPAVLVAVALLAGAIPAMRAMRIREAAALRS